MPPPVPASVKEGRMIDGQADLVQRLHPFGDRGDEPALRRFQADAVHRLAEQQPVLGHVDGMGAGADQLDAEFRQLARLVQRHRRVERGLPAHGGQQRVGPLALDDARDDVGRDRLDIGRVRQVRIGHDGGGIRVHQHHPVAFLLQRLAGLRAGIIELAGLADDDRPGADDHHGFDIGALRHDRKTSTLCCRAAQESLE